MTATGKKPKQLRNNQTINIAISKDVIEALDKAAEVERRSRSNMVEVIVDRWLQSQTSTATAA